MYDLYCDKSSKFDKINQLKLTDKSCKNCIECNDNLNDDKYDYCDPNYNMISSSNKSFTTNNSINKTKLINVSNENKLIKKTEFKNLKTKEFKNKKKNLKNSNNLDSPSPSKQLDILSCYTCEKSKLQTIQTYESVKYILMTIILVSIIDGLFTLNYQKLLIQHLQIILLKHKNPLLFCEYNKLFLFNDDKLRIATGSLYLINVSIQFTGFVGISNDNLILACSYAIYSIICFIFTIGTYLNYRRLLISLCINCLLAILSIVFAVMIKIVKPIKIKKRNIFVV